MAENEAHTGTLPRFGIDHIGVPTKSVNGIDSMFRSGDSRSFFDRITVPQGLLSLNELGNVSWSCDPEF